MIEAGAVEAVLGAGGVLSRSLPGYEVRPQQLQVASAVADALDRHHHLLAEAGTGTGKTFAYLVPAILSGRRTVVSTGTKTLQDQVFFKDLKLLAEHAGLSFSAAYLKGRSNYLCLDKLERARAAKAPILEAVDNWALRTQTGDLAELDLPEDPSLARLTTTSETCLGQRCASYESCFVTRARAKAQAADVVVVNHHLFFADLALKGTGAGEGVVPPYEVAIVDEAHSIEAVATEFFGYRISHRRLLDLCADAVLASEQSDHPKAALALAERLKAASAGFFLDGLSSLGSGSIGAALNERSLVPLRQAAVDFTLALGAMAAFGSTQADPVAAQLGRRAGDLKAQIDLFCAGQADGNVRWLENGGSGIELHLAPADVSDALAEHLYGSVDTVVYTSATLTVARSFDFFAKRIGLSRALDQGAARCVLADSPFDFPKQAAFYVPPHLPLPDEPDFLVAACEEILSLVRITSGRAFVLFTSLRNMTQAYERCRDSLPYQVLCQGQRPKSMLLAAFRAEPSVLFASQSFWEGVDVPGDALSLVILDKLPFASPGHPLVASRIDRLREQGEDPFNGYQLPHAAIGLKQGFGRLIRTRSDRGVVALLDRRLVVRRYGRVLEAGLPPAWRCADLSELNDWFKALSTLRAEACPTSSTPPSPRW